MWLNRVAALLVIFVVDFTPTNGQIPNRYRLTGYSRPVHYDLDMKIDVEAQEFSGSVEITLEVVTETSILDLHYKDMDCTNVKLTDNIEVYDLIGETYDDSTEIWKLNFPLMTPGRYQLSIDFKASIRTDLKGLYMSTYFDDSGTKNYIATTFMAPNYARMAFPCYDEPEYKANYTIHITHADKYFALSNMPADEQTDLGNGWTTTHFKESKPTSTYIVAFIVCDFERIYKDDPNFLSIYAQPAVIEDTEYALQHFEDVRLALESYLGRKYQYPKQDMIAIDDFLMGAMENWGLITYLSSRILVNNSTDIKTKIANSKTMSHEMAHQWFGNEVTHHYWYVVWLKEGMATLYEDLLTGIVHPEWRMADQFVINTMQFVMQQDAIFNVRTMMKDYTSPTEIRAVYDFVTYKKAGSIMRMMMNVLTPSVWKLAMDYYIEDNSFATATNVKLAAAWQRAIDHSNVNLPDIATVFTSWIYSAGFPVVTVTRDYSNTKRVTLKQQRFISSSSTFGTNIYIYHIPLNFATEEYPDFSDHSPALWLTEKEMTFLLPDVADNQWVIFNKHATGYYRVNYDESNWKLLIAVLKTNLSTIDPPNRAQLIDDALNLARYGQLNYKIALDLVTYIKKEEDFVPLTSAFTNLRELEKVSRGANLNIETFFLELVQELYESVKDKEPESDVERLQRVEIINFACKFAHQGCAELSYSALTSNNNDDLEADYRSAYFCGAVQYDFGIADDISAASLFYRLGLRSATEAVRRRNDKEVNEIISSFGCLKNTGVMETILSWTINGRTDTYFDKGDANKIFAAIASANITGTMVALNFLKNNYAEVSIKYESMVRVIEALAANVVTAELKTLYETIVETHINMDTVEEALKTALENAQVLINENMQFKEQRVETIREFFKGSASRPLLGSFVLLSLIIVGLKGLLL